MTRLTFAPSAQLAATACAALLLAACTTPPDMRRPDGPPTRVPPGLENVSDAVPRIEVIRAGGPNKPYEVLGVRYQPLAGDVPLQEQGLASWYGTRFHGKPTSSGEIYDMFGMTAAHKTMPIPSYARVRNPANGREIVVRINDRGPFAVGRVIDLSYTAALKLDLLRGVAPVQVQRITFDEIRSGSWAARGPARAPTATTPDTEAAQAAAQREAQRIRQLLEAMDP
jgi:rare lipoprotein A